MAIDQNAHQSHLHDDHDDDTLYCNEQQLEEEISVITSDELDGHLAPVLFPLLLLEQDLFCDDEDLKSLFRKEKEAACLDQTSLLSLSLPRKQAVEWILRITSHYGFSALTAILAVNYLDRFLDSLAFDKDGKPWMMQLAAVACLSLAAKVEETHVPLLLDLQVEGAEYVFEAKTIQRMELLVLSTLKWRMNPVTPLSFIHHVVRRVGLKSHAHWDFLNSCQNLLLSVIPDPRFILYLPSGMATATMLHVIHQVEPCNAAAYENQLLCVLKISKEEVNVCYEVLSDISSNTCVQTNGNALKRNLRQIQTNPDPIFSFDGSSSCISSSAHQPIFKKTRVEEQGMRLPSLSRVFVTANPN